MLGRKELNLNQVTALLVSSEIFEDRIKTTQRTPSATEALMKDYGIYDYAYGCAIIR